MFIMHNFYGTDLGSLSFPGPDPGPSPNLYMTAPTPNLYFTAPALNLYLPAPALHSRLPVLRFTVKVCYS